METASSKNRYIPFGKAGGVLAIFYFAITCGFGAVFIYGPIFPLMVLWPWLYRRLTEILSSIWQALLVAVIEKVFRVTVVLTGDRIERHEKTLVIMNHRTRLDWLYFFIPIFHFAVLNRQKITLKAPLKWMPGIGWAMQVAGYLFLERDWEKDKIYISDMLNYYMSLGAKTNYLFFPEGTDLTRTTVNRSQEFAKKNDYELYEYVLHPRTTGFIHMVKTMREAGEIDAIHDVTVAYPKTMPHNEMALVLGEYPPVVHFNIERHNIKDIPEDDEGLSEWCKNIWAEKERKLHKFYHETGNAEDCCFQNSKTPVTYDRSLALWMALIGWLLFVVFSLWLLWNFSFARWYCIVVILFYIGTGYLFGGVEKMEVFVNFKRKYPDGRPPQLVKKTNNNNPYLDIINKTKNS